MGQIGSIHMFILLVWQLNTINSAVVPNVTNLALITNTYDTIHVNILDYCVASINKNEDILPNTTLKAINMSLTHGNAEENIARMKRLDVAAVFEIGPGKKFPSEIAANLLNVAMFDLNRYHCDNLYTAIEKKFCSNTITLQPSLTTINKAVYGLIEMLKINKAIIVYDVFRSKQVAKFLALSKNTSSFHLIFLNFDKELELSSFAVRELKNLRSLKIKNVIPFIEPKSLELVIDLVNMQCTCATNTNGFVWILPIVSSSDQHAHPHDIVIGLKLSVNKTSSYFNMMNYMQKIEDEQRVNELPESALLLHDSVMLTARAIDNIIRKGDWLNDRSTTSISSFSYRTQNGGQVMKELRNMTYAGLTGSLTIGHGLHRDEIEIDVLNLRKDKFIKIGKYSKRDGLTMTGQIKKNRYLPSSNIALKTLRVVAMKQEPFVFVEEIGNGNVSYRGYSYDLLKRLSTELNFNFNIHLSKSASEEELIKEVKQGNADIILNPIVVSSKHQKDISFTKPFMHFTVGILARKQENKDLDMTQFMLPFTIPAWCLLLSSCIVVTVIVHLLDKYSPYGWRQTQQEQGEAGDEFSLFNSLWFCLACILTQGADNTPRNLSGRILAGCFWFCVLIWNATYTANLASFLVLKNNDLPIKSLNDDITNGYTATMLRDSAVSHVIEISRDPVHMKLWRKMNNNKDFVESHEDGARLTRSEPNIAFIAEEPFLRYYKGKKICNLAMVSNVLQPMSYAFALPLSSKYVDTMSISILKLQEQGTVESFERKWWEYQNQCPKEHQSVSQSRLGFKEMIGVYLVLLSGMILSVLVVGIEIWWIKSLGAKMKAFITSTKRKIYRGSSKVHDSAN